MELIKTLVLIIWENLAAKIGLQGVKGFLKGKSIVIGLSWFRSGCWIIVVFCCANSARHCEERLRSKVTWQSHDNTSKHSFREIATLSFAMTESRVVVICCFLL
jgi:hypothetical protein